MAGPKPRFTPEQYEEWAEHREAGKSYSWIARKFGCAPSTVSWRCLVLGVLPPKPARPQPLTASNAVVTRNGHSVRRYNSDDDARLLALEAEGKSYSEIGRELGRRHNSIRGRLLTLARQQALAEAC